MFQALGRGEFGAHSCPPQSSFVQHKCSMPSASGEPVGLSVQIETVEAGPIKAGRTSTNLQYESFSQSKSRAHGAAHAKSSVQKFVRQPMLKHCSPDSMRPTGSPHQNTRGSLAEPLLKIHSPFGHCSLAKHRV
jgi:hypothetical protein